MELDPKTLLEAEYLARRQKNASYSLRAFAKLLQLPSGRVSQLLSEKRRFTPALGKQIAGRLNFDPQKTDQLIEGIVSAKKKSAAPLKPQATYKPIAMDEFLVIADPVHFSLLSLLEVDDFSGSAKAASEMLGLSAVEARAAYRRLVRVGLVEEKNSHFVLPRPEARATSSEVNFAALRECHKKLLRDAIELIDTVPIEARDVTSITMAIDPKKLPEAKKRIKDFRRSMSEFLESGKKDSVYRINIQLLPVTKLRNK